MHTKREEEISNKRRTCPSLCLPKNPFLHTDQVIFLAIHNFWSKTESQRESQNRANNFALAKTKILHHHIVWDTHIRMIAI